jgi:hypothetical protein
MRLVRGDPHDSRKVFREQSMRVPHLEVTVALILRRCLGGRSVPKSFALERVIGDVYE